MVAGFSTPLELVWPSELSLSEVRGLAGCVSTSSVLGGYWLWKDEPWARPLLGLEQSFCEPYCLCLNHCPLVSGKSKAKWRQYGSMAWLCSSETLCTEVGSSRVILTEGNLLETSAVDTRGAERWVLDPPEGIWTEHHGCTAVHPMSPSELPVS